jgi:hypothetical protein
MLPQLQVLHRDGANTETADFNKKSLYLVSGITALVAGLLLLIALISLIISLIQPGAINSWLSLFQNNWLIIIFKLYAGFGGTQINLLHNLDFLNLAILVLVGALLLGLYVALSRTSRIWSTIALAQPFLRIILFIATKTAGRSAVRGAALVISVVMLRSNIFNKVTAYMGIPANVLLLTGDFSAGVIPPLAIVATLVGIGYMLLMTWMFLIAYMIFQIG